MSRWASSTAIRGLIALVAATVSSATGFAQAAPPAPAAQATLAKNPYTFSGDAAVTFSVIKADKTADFESILSKLRAALEKSARPERARQAASWKIFKASDAAPGGATIYVFLIDPVVKDTDYTPSKILAEAFPEEMRTLFHTLSDSYASQTIMNLSLVADLGR